VFGCLWLWLMHQVPRQLIWFGLIANVVLLLAAAVLSAAILGHFILSVFYFGTFCGSGSGWVAVAVAVVAGWQWDCFDLFVCWPSCFKCFYFGTICVLFWDVLWQWQWLGGSVTAMKKKEKKL
jgi:hypothetical protein